MLRTNTCGELTAKQLGEKVTLCGWVHRRRDHGGLIFIDLRDRYGITQLTFDSKKIKTADKLRSEWVIKVTGAVAERPKEMINKKLATGEIEVEASELEILSESKTPPFEISSPHEIPDEVGSAKYISRGKEKGNEANEDIRMKYRYLDLRRARMQGNLILRHKIIKAIRDFMDKDEFVEVETPELIKGTPEGAREFIVPSRLHAGKFYVLPQSPQQLKQLLMVAGLDKYFQIAKCFRDEDLRGDRQLEFTQLDVEMSFAEQNDVLNIMEKLMLDLTKKFAPKKELLTKPFPRLTYQEVMDKYGSDKPDLRFAMEIKPITELVKDCGFSVFTDVIKNKGVVHALKIDGGAKFSRKEIDELTEIAKQRKAKGLAYLTLKEGKLNSPIIKFIGEDLAQKIVDETGAKDGDIIFFGADKRETVCEVLGQIRLETANKLNLIDENKFAYAWIVDFPMFKNNKEGEEAGYSKDIAAMHHPFTRPHKDSLNMLKAEPLKAVADAYDLILNGYEIGGGSIRIHEQELQNQIFKILGISEEDRKKRFGHMLNAFSYGAPPHGGIALGLDRLIMIFAGEPNIREVIAYPKTGDGRDMMLDAPSEITDKQLKELHLKVSDK
ncbi:MAG: aspartate--tRNA ligase [Candidatus Falkowbacteria bacterium]